MVSAPQDALDPLPDWQRGYGRSGNVTGRRRGQPFYEAGNTLETNLYFPSDKGYPFTKVTCRQLSVS